MEIITACVANRFASIVFLFNNNSQLWHQWINPLFIFVFSNNTKENKSSDAKLLTAFCI